MSEVKTEGGTTPYLNPLVAGLILAIIGVAVLSVFAFIQHGNLSDVEAKAEKAESTLTTTKADLVEVEDTNTTLRSEIGEQAAQLDACEEVVEVSDHQYEQSLLLIGAVTDSLGGDYSAGTDKLEKAGDHADTNNGILEDNGYASWEEFWTACAADYDTI